jgi:hypothetical protein
VHRLVHNQEPGIMTSQCSAHGTLREGVMKTPILPTALEWGIIYSY